MTRDYDHHLWKELGIPPEDLVDLPAMLSDRDGYRREAALRQVKGPLPSPASFAAIVARLNDWVPAVRRAAEACAERSFPLTNPRVIAFALVGLLANMRHWSRWGRGPPKVLDDAIRRQDVADRLAENLRTSTEGGVGRLLRTALSLPGIDKHLVMLAGEAASPAVRGIALQSLIEGKAKWPDGYEAKWIDKSMGESRLVIRFAERVLSVPVSREMLLERAAGDKAAGVRRVAADAMVKHRATLGNVEELLAVFRNDRSAGVRLRAEFVDRDRAAKETAG